MTLSTPRDTLILHGTLHADHTPSTLRGPQMRYELRLGSQVLAVVKRHHLGRACLQGAQAALWGRTEAANPYLDHRTASGQVMFPPSYGHAWLQGHRAVKVG